MSWLAPGEYNENDICPICKSRLGTSAAIYMTECDHIFHNDCLDAECVSRNGNVNCPICSADLGNDCISVWGFKNKALGNANGAPLFNGNQHILSIYNNQGPPSAGPEGGRKQKKTKKSRRSRRRTKRSRRTKKSRKTKK
jgi:hypothetical protein